MSTKQIMRGTRSHSVEVVTPALFDRHLGQWMLMIRDYFKRSYDRTSDPDSSFKDIRRRIEFDDRFLLVAYMGHGIPTGFLAGDMVGEVARILNGYLPPKTGDQDRSDIINQALDIFESWARSKKAVGGVFYAYRPPGVHKMMVKRGWAHDLSIYKKEL